MTLPADPAVRHRAVAAGFTTRVRGASDWDAPAPVAGWRARDVVGHLVEWFPDFLKTGTGLVLDRGPSPEEDPVAAWVVHADAAQRLLDGPDADTPFRHPTAATSRPARAAWAAPTRPGGAAGRAAAARRCASPLGRCVNAFAQQRSVPACVQRGAFVAV